MVKYNLNTLMDIPCYKYSIVYIYIYINIKRRTIYFYNNIIDGTNFCNNKNTLHVSRIF